MVIEQVGVRIRCHFSEGLSVVVRERDRISNGGGNLIEIGSFGCEGLLGQGPGQCTLGSTCASTGFLKATIIRIRRCLLSKICFTWLVASLHRIFIVHSNKLFAKY